MKTYLLIFGFIFLCLNVYARTSRLTTNNVAGITKGTSSSVTDNSFARKRSEALLPTLSQKQAPLSFIENKGQVTDQNNKPRHDIQFKIAAANGLNIFIGDGAIHYQFSRCENPEALAHGQDDKLHPENHGEHAPVTYDMYRMDVELLGANKNAQVITEQGRDYYENYYTAATGQEGATAHAWQRIVYKNIYPHIDWALYIKRGQLEHEFLVHPGGSVSDIQLMYGGATSLKLNNDGRLVANTPQGTITENAPYTYQKDGTTVASAFKLAGDVLSYDVGTYSGELVIDPSLSWGTYYGGSNNDFGQGVAVDDSGNVYTTGSTRSISGIATSGAYHTTFSGGVYNAFLAKFNSSGAIQWATYYGGGDGEGNGQGVATDGAGNVYIAGVTSSTYGVSTSGAYQTTFGGGSDAFLAKFNSSGAIQWATYYGGVGSAGADGVAIDGSGNVYITGQARNDSSGIATSGAYQTTYGGRSDAFLAKFDSSGAIQWATYYGGSDDDYGLGVATDGSGNVYITGVTYSTSGIATSGAYQTSLMGGSPWPDGFLAKFNSSGAIQWATYYGTGAHNASAVATDVAGNVYITGGAMRVFLAKFNGLGAIQWGTSYGSFGGFAQGVATDVSGNVYITGETSSTSGIATCGAYQTSLAGSQNAFLARFSGSGALQWGSYYGGSGVDYGNGVATNGSGNVYVVGYSNSPSGIATSGAYQTSLAGSSDAFLADFQFSSTTTTPAFTGGSPQSLTLCEGSGANAINSLLQLTDSGTGLTETYTVTANPSNGSIAVGSTVTSGIAVSPTGWSYTPTSGYSGTDAFTIQVCNGDYTATTTINVTVNPLPTITLGTNPTICRGATTAPLPYSSTTGSPDIYTISWDSAARSHGFPNIGPGGIITTVAGNGTMGYSGDGGPATSASISLFNGIYHASHGVTVDRSGNIYLADAGNSRIRKVDHTTGMITTIAGNGTPGYSGDGGPATAATLALPSAIDVDPSGNIYFTDPDNKVIRKIDNGGIITTIAGTGTHGYSGDGGPATAAQLHLVGWSGIKADAAGNLYVCDLVNFRVRKINSSGIISTMAGDGTYGYSGDGGQATTAQLANPTGIAVDAAGNLFISDIDFHIIRKVSAAGIITTYAGSGVFGYAGDGGAATAATFSSPTGIGLDRSGNLYIADQVNKVIRKVDMAGIVSTVAGNGVAGFSGDGGAATAAQFQGPTAVAVDTLGNLYIADNILHMSIRKVSAYTPLPPSPVTISVPGTAPAGVHTATLTVSNGLCSSISYPVSVIIDSTPNAGVITGSSSVSVGSSITLSDTASGGTWSSSNPSIATAGSTGIVTGVSAGVDTISYTVTNVCGSAVATKVVTVNPLIGGGCNKITTFAGTGFAGYSGDGGPATAADLSGPWSTAVDGAGNIYVVDQGNHRIRKKSPSGIITTIAGNGTSGYSGDGGAATLAQLSNPHTVAVDGAGNVYVADFSNNRIRKIDASGIITTVAGDGTIGYSGDGGAATLARLSNPVGVALDGAGNLYIADYQNHRIRKVDNLGTITTFAGDGTSTYGGDGGAATAAQFLQPRCITTDGAGNVYFSTNNHVIRKVNTLGIISTYAGTGSGGYSGDGGPATAALINTPQGLAIDAPGNLYIGEESNHRVRKVSASGIISTVAGTGIAGFSGDGGAATSAQLNNPVGVSVDGAGNLYVADISNNRVRLIVNGVQISGSATLCTGSTTTLGSLPSGGTWTSSNTSTATVGSVTGVVTGVAPGTATITYSTGTGCNATIVITVNPAPAISGPATVCTGASATLGSSPSGGTWSSSNTAIATVASASGTVTGVAPGSAVITYSLGGGCQATTTVSVLSLPVVPSITGSTLICMGSTTALGNPMSGGFWYSTDISIATVSSSGLVTSVSGGAVAIVYAVANSCGIGFNSTFVTVNATSPITGPSTLCVGASATLVNSVTGGTWTSSNPLVAPVGSSSGAVTGLSAGSATITYTLSPGCYSTHALTVNSSSVSITGVSTVCVSLSVALTGTPPGGTWSSSNPSVATIGSGTGTVVGIAPGVTNITYSPDSGCLAVRAFTVSATAGPIAGVSGVCTGSTTTLGHAIPGGIWSSASTFFATVGSTTGVVYGASPGTSVITYTIGVGCTSSKTITVRPLPAIIPVTGGGTMCAGGPGINVGMPGSAVGIYYLLQRGGVPVGAPLVGTGSSLSFGLQTIAGIYTVRAIDPVTFCDANMSGGATITVFPLPVIGVSPGVSVCSGASATLTATGGTTYTWSPPAGLSSTVGSSVTALPTITTTYTVTGTGSFGCTNKATVTVTVNPLPAVSAGPGVAICNGSFTTLTASGAVSYVWSPATGLSSTTGASVSASPSTTRTYTVTGTSSGCTNRATVTVSVNALPTISAGSGRSICSGSSTTLAASGGATYTWSPPAGLAATTGASVVASPTVTTTYTVTGTNGAGCVNRASVTVTVNSLPTISASSGGTICSGASVTLTASGGIAYVWSPSTGLFASTGASVIASPTVTTTYTVSGTNSNGCVNNATVTVTLNASPSPISSTGALCAGSAVTLTNSVPGGTWSSSNPSVASIGSATGITTGIATGTATISYTLSSGCRATMGVTVAVSPSAIAGPGAIYTASTATYTNASPGGTWSSSNTAIVSIGSTSGIATGVAVGSATVTYTVFSGCSATLLVSVSATPAAFSVTGGGAYCTGGAAVVIGLSGSQVGVSYQLYRGGSPVGSAVAGTGAAFSFGSFTTAGTYTVIANPSGSSPVTMSGSAVVTVIPSTLVPAPVPVTGGGTICAGAPGTAVGLSSGSAVTVNYQLYRNGILTGSPLPGTGTALSFGLQTVAGVYTVIGTSTVNGCSSNMTGGASVTVFPAPNVYDVTGGGSYCAGGAGVVIGLNNSQSGVNYRLYNGPSPVGSLYPGTGAAISFGLVTTAGSYTVVGASTTCSATMAGTVTVSINPLPTITGATYLVAPAATITLTGSPTGGTWTSSTPTVATIGSSTGIVTGVSLGGTTISYTLPNGCRGTRTVYVTSTGHRPGPVDSTSFTSSQRKIYVIPNPSSGTFWVRGDIGDEAEATIEMFNMLGQKILSRFVVAQDGKIDEQIVLNDVANGTYLLNIKSAGYRDVFHVVLTR